MFKKAFANIISTIWCSYIQYFIFMIEIKPDIEKGASANSNAKMQVRKKKQNIIILIFYVHLQI